MKGVEVNIEKMRLIEEQKKKKFYKGQLENKDHQRKWPRERRHLQLQKSSKILKITIKANLEKWMKKVTRKKKWRIMK